MSLHLLQKLLSVIIPPRTSERDVEALTLEDLAVLQTHSGLPYANAQVRSLVWELKYHANPRAAALAGELLSEELLAIASEELGTPLLLPVPMHKTRIRERGHNQTMLLCEAALRVLGGQEDFSGKIVWPAGGRRPEDFFTGKSSCPMEYMPQALERTRHTPEQQKLSREKRLTNLKNSMAANPELVEGRVCVVVDDVTTTGATLAEAKRALLQAGAAKVHTIALAHS